MKEQLAEAKMHAVDYWQIIRNRWGTILLTFLLVVLAALIVVNLIEKKHMGRAKFQIHADAKEQVFDQKGGFASATWLETEFKIITSRETLLRVVEELQLTKRWGMRDKNEAVDKLGAMVEPNEERGTEMITIEVYSPDAAEAAELANAVKRAYEERRRSYMQDKAAVAINALEREMEEQDRATDEKRRTMITIMKKNKILDMGGYSGWHSTLGKVDNETDEIYRVEALDTAKLEHEVNSRTIQLTEMSKLQGEALIDMVIYNEKMNSQLRELLPQRLNLKMELEQATGQGLGAKHPKVTSLRAQQAELNKTLTSAVDSMKQTLSHEIEMMQKVLADRKTSSTNTKEDMMNKQALESEYIMAKREYEQQLSLANEMREHIMKEKVDHMMPIAPIQTHEEAFPDNKVARPNIPLLLGIGSVIGLVLGLVLAFFLEYMDTSVKTLDDVERYLGVPVLAVIPKDVGVLHKQSGLSPDAEAYRILRTNIEFNRRSADANAITIVSGGAGEGKSTTLVNLAFICAQGGYNTLMIDGDLRRPKLHTFFDINNSVGLTNYLTTALQLEDVILQTPIDNLYFMPSGILPADAAGILNSRRMSELIQDLKNRFDLVLIDSPPILGVSDASVLASEVDLTMIVIQHRKLPRNMLLRVKQAVENVGGTVLGVVLNNVDVRSDSQYQYYTSYYTYYSPSTPEGRPKTRRSSSAPEGGASSGKSSSSVPATVSKSSTASSGNDTEDNY